MELPVEDAYREACAALGESLVHRRILEAEVQRLRGETAELAEVVARRPQFPPAPVQQFDVRGDLPPSGRTDRP